MLNEFGGDWTSEKLSCLESYLNAYVRILRKSRYYRIHYVDAFAGSGYISPTHSQDNSELNLFEKETKEANKYLEGSTRIALSITPGFDQYIFIEKNSKHSKALEQLKNEYPNQAPKIRIENRDANEFLSDWCSQKQFNKINRAVVFLDPYGMQVTWSLLETIAKTEAIDLWILFPVFGANRMLTKGKQPPQSWADCLTRTFGTEEWKMRFYETKPVLTLFGEEETTCKSATIEMIGKFFINRLQTIFPSVTKKPLLLCNSKNNPLYLLCFAAANPKGGPIAVKIASDIINKKSKEQ